MTRKGRRRMTRAQAIALVAAVAEQAGRDQATSEGAIRALAKGLARACDERDQAKAQVMALLHFFSAGRA